jgi:hypothetical protein
MKKNPTGFFMDRDDLHHSLGLTAWQAFTIARSFDVFIGGTSPFRVCAEEVVVDGKRDQLVFLDECSFSRFVRQNPGCFLGVSETRRA